MSRLIGLQVMPDTEPFVSTLIRPHRARVRSGRSSERQPGRLFTASTGLSPDGGLQASHTAQGSRSASGSADGTTSRRVMEKAGENAPDPPSGRRLIKCRS
jgi:hypothetical protein